VGRQTLPRLGMPWRTPSTHFSSPGTGTMGARRAEIDEKQKTVPLCTANKPSRKAIAGTSIDIASRQARPLRRASNGRKTATQYAVKLPVRLKPGSILVTDQGTIAMADKAKPTSRRFSLFHNIEKRAAAIEMSPAITIRT